MNPDKSSYPGSLSDSDLDRLLAATNTELLAHIETVADPTPGLMAIMAHPVPTPAGDREAITAHDHDGYQNLAALAIGMRASVRHFTSRLDQAHDLISSLARALDLDLDVYRYLNRPCGIVNRNLNLGHACEVIRDLTDDLTDTADFICSSDLNINHVLVRGLVRDLTLTLDLTAAAELTLNLTLELTSAFDLIRALDLARDLDHKLAHTLARDVDLARDRVHGHGHVIDRDLAFARDSAYALDRTLIFIRDRNLGRSRALALAHDLAVDLVRNIKRILDRESGRADTLARELSAQEVDASGADLSGMAIEDLDVLEGVIWTRQTVWPPDIADHVRACSRLIRPGVYQVGQGNDDPDRFTLIAV